MATIKIKFRNSSLKTKEGTVFFQIIHNRMVRQINTGYKIFPSEWDRFNAQIILPVEISDERRSYLIILKNKIKSRMSQLANIISELEKSGKPFTSDLIVMTYRQTVLSYGFLTFIRNQILVYKKTGKFSASEKLQAALNSFILFHGEEELLFGEIDVPLMEAYEAFLKNRGICMNTISFYMRVLRSVYNKAVMQGMSVQQYPFQTVYTGIGKTVKRAVSLTVIRQIRNLDLSLCPALDFARDMFLFSFYTRGMSFVDMSFLKKKDLRDGFLIYRRQKTNQQLIVKWENPMQEIVDKYDTGDSPFLLPIIKNLHQDARRQYKNAEHLVNNKLKLIGKKIGLNIPLTTYVARHGWASIAYGACIPTATISEALGHDSEKTTRIYLASLDTSAVDRANSQILRSL